MSATIPSLRRARAQLARGKQSARITIRLFEDERKTLQERAHCANKSVAAYLRDCALSPIPLQSSAIPEPKHEVLESLSNSNVLGDEQTFVHQAIEAKKSNEQFSKQVESERDPASERTGHARGCGCFACERLRGMIESSTTIDSGENRENKGKTPKSKRINAR